MHYIDFFYLLLLDFLSKITSFRFAKLNSSGGLRPLETKRRIPYDQTA